MTRVREVFVKPDYGPAPESDRIAMDWLEEGKRVFGHYIGGRWEAGNGALEQTFCPADGRRLAGFRLGSEDDVDRAVAAAHEALPAWQALGGHGRARYLYRLARQVQKRSRQFAVVESLDNGKPIRESRDLDIPLVARHFYHHAGWAQLLDTELAGYRGVGVVGQIVPWNFPLLMLAWKVAPALAAGNTTVLKPAEYTPLSALLFAEVAHETGLPPGVLNVVTGAGETGAALVRHPGVSKIAFTGSTQVGREIRIATAGSGKHLSLELGGKSPFLVFDSADLDAAAEGVVDAIWFNQGQVCCAGSRLLVQESVEEDFLDRLRARMETLRVGHPLDKSVDMGAIVDRTQLDRIEEYLEIGRADGAQVWQPSRPMPEGGLFFPPTLCTGVPSSSRIVTDEIFGPVVVSLTFRTPEEAVALANDTRYGLAASLWTEDLNLALDVAPRIKAGTVWINSTNLFDAASGFGGYRESGFGREGGLEGMWEYLEPTVHPPLPWEAVSGAGVTTEPTGEGPSAEGVDRTRKLYVGGRQKRPDGGYSLTVLDREGAPYAEVPRGNRKDVRDAVEAAAKAREGWARSTGHLRAQILYFIAENLSQREEELAREVERSTGVGAALAREEIAAAVGATFTFAAWADKFDGRVHATPFRNVTLAMNEAAGTVGIRCGDVTPLAGALGAAAAALSQGNVVVLIPSARFPVPALDLVQVFETSDLPPGVLNVVSGLHDEVVPTLAAHDDVDGLWDFVGDDLSAEVERLSAGNLKRVWIDREGIADWLSLNSAAEQALLRQSVRVKNIWVPYGA